MTHSGFCPSAPPSAVPRALGASPLLNFIRLSNRLFSQKDHPVRPEFYGAMIIKYIKTGRSFNARPTISLIIYISNQRKIKKLA